MSDIATAKKRPAAKPSKVPEDDHRKRRRNRTTQSCLNCHTSKRMCDRQRPCGRCTQLGLTGLCVYEVDDPIRAESSDETSRLQRRVAELEGVVRDLKNKPHPRWAQSALDPSYGQQKWHSRAKPSSSLSGDSSDDGREATPPFDDVSFHASPPPASSSDGASPYNGVMHTSSPSSPPLSSPSTSLLGPTGYDTHIHPSTQADFDLDLSSFLSEITATDQVRIQSALQGVAAGDHYAHPSPIASPSGDHHNHVDGHCGCLANTPEYYAMLELSLRLRKAADTLRQSTRHRSNSECALLQRIATWDTLTTYTLGNILTPPGSVPMASPTTPAEAYPSSSTASGAPPPYHAKLSQQTQHPFPAPAGWDLPMSHSYPPRGDGAIPIEATNTMGWWSTSNQS